MTTPAIVKKADLKRMMAAVQESGYDSARIVIDPRTGKVNILLGPKAASKRCGIHVTPYSLRHTGAVWAVEAGATMDELAQLMGHDDATTTAKHYARFSPVHLKSVVARVHRKNIPSAA